MSDEKYLEFYKKYSLLEINTLMTYPESRRVRNGKVITDVWLQRAYGDRLEGKAPFTDIDWSKEPFSRFDILKDDPARRLITGDDGVLIFEDDGAPINDWKSFIIGFKQVRNNLTHGSKFYKENGHDLGLDDRDDVLIEAAVAFIDYLGREFELTLDI